MRVQKRNIIQTLVLASILAFFSVVVFSNITRAATGINSQISFQGKLVNTNGTNVPDGVYNLQFKIYQDGDGCVASGASPCNGTLKWTESRLVNASQGVTVTAGTFQVNLGSVNTALAAAVDFNQDSLWLSMNVGGTANTASPTYDGEMTPFIRLTSVPYALNAGKVGGLTASQLVQLNPGAQQTGAINVSGNITSNGALAVNGNGASNINGALAVAATLSSPKFLLGADLSLIPIAGSQSAISTYWGLQLVGNRQGSIDYTPTTVGSAGAYGVVIPNQQAGSVALLVQGANTQSGDLLQLQNNGGTVLAKISSTGALTAVGVNSGTGLIQGTGGLTVGGAITFSSFTASGILLNNGFGVVSSLANVAAGSCLTSTGTTTAPTWSSCGGGAALTIGTLDNFTTAANGATISSGSLYLQSASNGYPGVVNTAAQTFAGAKTFNGALTAASTLSVGSATVPSGGVAYVNGNVGIGTSTVIGQLQLESGTYRSNQLLLNNGVTGTPPAYPNSYLPSLSVIVGQVSGSRPLFFGYSNAGAYSAFLTSGACGNYNQMCLDLGNGTTAYTALQNVGNVLRVGGGDDGNFGYVNLYGNVGVGNGNSPSLFSVGASSQFQVSSAGAVTGVGINSGSGLVQGTGGLTIAGTITLSSQTTAGVLLNNGSGVVSSLAGVAAGSCLKSNGVGAAPIYDVCYAAATPTLQSAYDGGRTINQIAAGTLTLTSGTTVPTADQFVIDNTGSSGVTTAGVNGASIKYKGGAAAVEASGLRIDYAPGTTSGGTWSGLRIVANATGPVAGVNTYGIKLEGATAQGAGTETGLYIGTGWDIGVDVASGGLQIATQAADPALPTGTQIKIFAKSIAGRSIPKWVSADGSDTPFQSGFGFNRIAMAAAAIPTTPSATNLFTTWGTTTTSTAATLTQQTLASTNLSTSTVQSRITTSATAGNVASHNQQLGTAWRGNAAGTGGFFFITRFSLPSTTAGNRGFIGLTDTPTATNTDPLAAATPAKMGIAYNTNTGNFSWVNNTSGTAPTTSDLGTNFALSTTKLFELSIYCPPYSAGNNGNTVTYRLKDIATNNSTGDITVTTNLPSATSFMAPQIWTSTTTTTPAAIQSTGWYLESDN